MDSQQKHIQFQRPVFCPFHETDPYAADPFEVEIIELPNNICSGSPWVMGRNGFVGFQHFAPAVIRHLGDAKFAFEWGEGQALFERTGSEPRSYLHEYNNSVLDQWEPTDRDFGDVDLLSKHEYCTWVEQRLCRTAGPEPDVLTQTFAERYLERLLELDLPPGKFTLDHGWFPKIGSGSIGDWEFDRDSFPHPDKLIDRLIREGFTPGIWLAPHLVQAGTALAALPNSRSGSTLKWGGIDACGTNSFDLLDVNEQTEAHYSRVLSRLVGMGFRKFKLDIFYASKRTVLPVLEMVSRLIREQCPEAEIECHSPDIHLSRYANVIRANDVWVRSAADLSLAALHFRVCRLSSPHRILNLDHLGGNAPRTPIELALAHFGFCAGMPGYPVVSALPDRFGKDGLQIIREILQGHEDNRHHLAELARHADPGMM